MTKIISMACNPGFIPKLLGCTSDDLCEEVSLTCALLSLVVALVIPASLGFLCYVICSNYEQYKHSDIKHD